MFYVREEILAQAQSRETRALRVRRSTKILLSSLSEQVHAERQFAPTPDASSQRRRACEKEIQQLEGLQSTRLPVRRQDERRDSFLQRRRH